MKPNKRVLFLLMGLVICATPGISFAHDTGEPHTNGATNEAQNSDQDGLTTGQIVGLSLAGAGLILGTGTFVWFNSMSSRYNEQLSVFEETGATSNSEPYFTRSDCQEAQRRSMLSSTGAGWTEEDVEFCTTYTANPSTISRNFYLGAGAGVILAVSGAALFLISTSNTQNTQLIPVLTPNFQGAQLQFSF